MELGLRGRTALVCGASKGIGRGIAEAFAREGVKVAVLARGRDLLEQTAEEFRRDSGVEVLVLPADLTDAASVSAAAQAMREAPSFAALNILVNNAGVPITRPDRQIFWSDEEWQQLIEVKAVGALRVVREFLPLMARDGSGRVINITGASGTAVWQTALMHGFTNSALLQMTGYLAKDLWAERVTVNAIIPGLVGTEYRQEWASSMAEKQGTTKAEFLAKACRAAGIFMERWAEVDEIANLAVFLASDAAQYITGAKIPIDGGLSVNAR